MRAILIIGLCITSFVGQGQATNPYKKTANKNSIRVDPLSVIFFSLGVKYERYINKVNSVQLGVLFAFDPAFTGEEAWSGQIYTLEYRYFISEKVKLVQEANRTKLNHDFASSPLVSSKKRRKIKRTFIAPYLRYQDLYLSGFIRNGVIYEPVFFNTFGGGVIIGRVIEVSKWLVLDYYIGINYQTGKDKLYEIGGTTDWLSENPPYIYRAPKAWFGWGARAGISIGVQF